MTAATMSAIRAPHRQNTTVSPAVVGSEHDIGTTPVCSIALDGLGRCRLLVKLEGANPSLSIKDRVAQFMLDQLERRGVLRVGHRIVEATSGNMGVSLAWLTGVRGYRFTAVTDPRATPENLARMRALGADVEVVRDRDVTGGYLLTRLDRARELARRSGAVWPDQHSNSDNPRAHFHGTGPELLSQVRGIGAVFIPASTGGTVAGLATFLRRHSPATVVVAVDSPQSALFGGRPGPRAVNGLGSSHRSPFVGRADVDEVIRVAPDVAFGYCLELQYATGLLVGGSSGAAIAAAVDYLRRHPRTHNPVCICPDSGTQYASTIFDQKWLASHGYDHPVIATHNTRTRE